MSKTPLRSDLRRGKAPRTRASKGVLRFGGDGEDRTPDLCNANATLSQLSYAPICSCIIAPLRQKIDYLIKL